MVTVFNEFYRYVLNELKVAWLNVNTSAAIIISKY